MVLTQLLFEVGLSLWVQKTPAPFDGEPSCILGCFPGESWDCSQPGSENLYAGATFASDGKPGAVRPMPNITPRPLQGPPDGPPAGGQANNSATTAGTSSSQQPSQEEGC